VEEQFAKLGIDLKQLDQEMAQRSMKIDKEANQARARAERHATGRTLAAAMSAAVAEFFKAVFHP